MEAAISLLSALHPRLLLEQCRRESGGKPVRIASTPQPPHREANETAAWERARAMDAQQDSARLRLTCMRESSRAHDLFFLPSTRLQLLYCSFASQPLVYAPTNRSEQERTVSYPAGDAVISRATLDRRRGATLVNIRLDLLGSGATSN